MSAAFADSGMLIDATSKRADRHAVSRFVMNMPERLLADDVVICLLVVSREYAKTAAYPKMRDERSALKQRGKN